MGFDKWENDIPITFDIFWKAKGEKQSLMTRET